MHHGRTERLSHLSAQDQNLMFALNIQSLNNGPAKTTRATCDGYDNHIRDLLK
jgi:hypothetical protein